MKFVRSFLLLVVVMLTLAPPATAVDFGVRAGRYNEAGEEFVGAEVLIDLGTLNLNPNIEYLLEDDVTAGSVNLDLTLDLGNFARVTPYVGLGAGLSYFDGEGLGTESDLLGNALAGITLNFDFLKPYAQVKYFRSFDDDTDGDEDELALTIGLRF